MIDPAELDSLANSPFAKQKADRIIKAAVLAGDPGSFFDELLLEHEMVDYRLVTRQTLLDALGTIQTLSANYQKLMEETAPLIIEAAKTPGNKWNVAERLINRASDEVPPG